MYKYIHLWGTGVQIQSGEVALDGSRCRSLSAKEPLIIQLFCNKKKFHIYKISPIDQSVICHVHIFHVKKRDIFKNLTYLNVCVPMLFLSLLFFSFLSLSFSLWQPRDWWPDKYVHIGKKINTWHDSILRVTRREFVSSSLLPLYLLLS